MSKQLNLEIGRNLIKMALIDVKSATEVKVIKTAVIETEDDATKDGRVRVSEDIIAEIKNGLAKNKMNCDSVGFVVDSTRILYKQMTYPYMSAKNLRNALNLAVSNIFPSVDESLYHIAFSICDTIIKSGNKMHILDVYAIPNDLSESYYSLAVALRMTPKGFTTVSHGTMVLFKDIIGLKNTAIVNVGEANTAISIISEGKMVSARSIPFGLDKVINVIKNSDITPDNMDMISSLELLYTQNILDAALPSSSENIYSEQDKLRYEASTALNSLIGGIEDTIRQDMKSTGTNIQDMIITGLGAGVSNISKLFATEFGISVKTVQTSNKIALSRQPAEDILFISMFPTLSSAVDTTNLFTDQERVGGEYAKKKRVDKIMFLVCLLIFLSTSSFTGVKLLNLSQTRTDEKARASELAEEIADLEAKGVVEVKEEYENALSYQTEIMNFYAQTENENEDLRFFLEELESVLPETAVITNLSMTPTSANFSIQCENEYIAAALLHRLRNMTYGVNMQCGGVAVDPDTKISSMTVSVTLLTSTERELMDNPEDVEEETVEADEEEAVEDETAEEEANE